MRRVRTGFVACVGLALLTAHLAGNLHAEELLPIQSRTIDSGPVSGAAYYTDDASGSRLVATLGGDEGSAPVRVVATLAAGQSVTLSVPAGIGEPSVEVTFSHRRDRVFIDDGGLQPETAGWHCYRTGQPGSRSCNPHRRTFRRESTGPQANTSVLVLLV